MSAMDVTDEEEQAFFDGKRSLRLPYVLNDVVRIKEGQFRGQDAWVVRVCALEPEPRYLLEMCSGAGDLEATISQFESHQE